MKLTYRGIKYQAPKSQSTSISKLVSLFTYRGVAYTKNPHPRSI